MQDYQFKASNGEVFDIRSYRLKEDFTGDVWNSVFVDADESLGGIQAGIQAKEQAERAELFWNEYHDVFIIRPLKSFSHANYSKLGLIAGNEYEAIHATNQPDWNEKGKVFAMIPKTGASLLLENGEYELVS